MKTTLVGLTLLAGFAIGAMASADAEIQIFYNYRSYDDYDAKVVSDWDYVVSAGELYIYPGRAPRNAACFKGEAGEALDLFRSMVDVYNRQTGRRIGIAGTVYARDSSGRLALAIDEIDETGLRQSWFPRMRECDRWSTAQERLRNP